MWLNFSHWIHLLFNNHVHLHSLWMKILKKLSYIVVYKTAHGHELKNPTRPLTRTNPCFFLPLTLACTDAFSQWARRLWMLFIFPPSLSGLIRLHLQRSRRTETHTSPPSPPFDLNAAAFLPVNTGVGEYQTHALCTWGNKKVNQQTNE